MYWKGEDTSSKSVGLMVKCKLAKSVMDAGRISPRILSVDLMLCGKVLTIISVYRPQSGRSEEDENYFYDDVSAEVYSKNVNCIVLGNFNGHVGNAIDEYEGGE